MPIRLLLAATLPSMSAAVLIAVRPVYGAGWPWLMFNLVLALMPLALAAAMTPRKRVWLVVPWLAFFPNAPYLVSDLVHYARRPPVPSWFDAAMLGSTGAAGLVAGAVSAVWVGRCLAGRWGGWPVAVGWLGVCVLSGRAIELGRVQRHNSWDLVVDPLPVLVDVVRSLHDPTAHAEVWGITAAYAVIIAGWSAALWMLIPPPRAPDRAARARGAPQRMAGPTLVRGLTDG